MTIQETNKIMLRIKEHYQDFIIDEGKIEEWYTYLKDYSYSDVSKKLDEHLMSEQYGQYIPKIAFLVKYLTKEEDKGKKVNYKVQCLICKKYIYDEDYDEHYRRCSSVNYMDNQYYKYTGKRLDREKLYKMSEDEFRKKYRSMLELVKSNTADENEKERVSALLEMRAFNIQTNIQGI